MTSAHLLMGCIGVAALIVRPGELGERIPAPEQIRTGVIAGALAAVGLALACASEILALLHGMPVRGDVPGSPVGRRADGPPSLGGRSPRHSKGSQGLPRDPKPHRSGQP